MSLNDSNPSTIFGGTWQQITGRFLLAAGGGYTAGATGGEATHKLTISEMPSHNHGIYYKQIGSGGSYTSVLMPDGTTTPTGSTGGGSAHNNMPPYLVVYIWKRTA